MPRRFSAAEVEAALRPNRLYRTKQEGSHIRLSAHWHGLTQNVTLVAREKVIPARRMSSILRQAGISAGEMLRLITCEDIAE